MTKDLLKKHTHKCTVTWTMTKLVRMLVSNCKSDMAIRSLTIRIYTQVTRT